MISSSSTLVDVAFAVCTALDRAGFEVVLTGGSAATYYAPDAYQSRDIDFVITLTGERGEAVLARLGYQRSGDSYLHSESLFPLDFPPGPLMVGGDHITRWVTATRPGEVLHVLSPTDCCRDRLAPFLAWNDFSALEQALAVYHARGRDIDLALIRDWCEREGNRKAYELFEGRLQVRSR